MHCLKLFQSTICFQTDWNDGQILCELVSSLGGNLGDYNTASSIERLQYGTYSYSLRALISFIALPVACLFLEENQFNYDRIFY